MQYDWNEAICIAINLQLDLKIPFLDKVYQDRFSSFSLLIELNFTLTNLCDLHELILQSMASTLTSSLFFFVSLAVYPILLSDCLSSHFISSALNHISSSVSTCIHGDHFSLQMPMLFSQKKNLFKVDFQFHFLGFLSLPFIPLFISPGVIVFYPWW